MRAKMSEDIKPVSVPPSIPVPPPIPVFTPIPVPAAVESKLVTDEEKEYWKAMTIPMGQPQYRGRDKPIDRTQIQDTKAQDSKIQDIRNQDIRQ
jgi:hypothetical protein